MTRRRGSEEKSGQQADIGKLETGNLPGHLIRRLHQIAVSIFINEAKAASYDITPVQYGALIATRQFPGIDQARLASIIACDRVTIGGVVDRLEKRKFLERKFIAGDKRSKRVYLLPPGEKALDDLAPQIEAAQDIILRGLSDIERSLMVALLSKAIEAANEMSRVPARPMGVTHSPKRIAGGGARQARK